MPTPILPTYTLAPETKPHGAVEMLNRFLNGEMIAFVVKEAGCTLEESLSSTGLAEKLGQIGITKDPPIRFHYDSLESVPAILPAGFIEWRDFGVTPLHVDQVFSSHGTKLSANHTSLGQSELLIHEANIGLLNWGVGKLWDALNTSTGDLIKGLPVDSELLDPRGVRAVAGAHDLIIFDASYLHMAISTQLPRTSKSTFYELT